MPDDSAHEISKLANPPLPQPHPFIVPVLLALLITIVGYLAVSLHASIDGIDKRTLKIENALGGGSIPAAETAPKGQKPDGQAAAPDAGLADSLNAIKEDVAATRAQVDAIRSSIADLQKFASTAKDATPAGFVADEMLVAQKGLVVKTTPPGGSASAGTRTWLATPSHDMLDFLLKIPPGKSSRIITFAPKQKNQVKSIDVYDRNSKGAAVRIADCQTEDRRLRCKLNVSGPTVLQVIAKTQGEGPLDVELEPAS